MNVEYTKIFFFIFLCLSCNVFFHGFYVFSLGYLNIKFVLEIHHCYHQFYVRHVGRYHLSCEGAISPSRMCKEGKVGKGVYAQFVFVCVVKILYF